MYHKSMVSHMCESSYGELADHLCEKLFYRFHKSRAFHPCGFSCDGLAHLDNKTTFHKNHILMFLNELLNGLENIPRERNTWDRYDTSSLWIVLASENKIHI